MLLLLLARYTVASYGHCADSSVFGANSKIFVVHYRFILIFLGRYIYHIQNILWPWGVRSYFLYQQQFWEIVCQSLILPWYLVKCVYLSMGRITSWQVTLCWRIKGLHFTTRLHHLWMWNAMQIFIEASSMHGCSLFTSVMGKVEEATYHIQ